MKHNRRALLFVGVAGLTAVAVPGVGAAASRTATPAAGLRAAPARLASPGSTAALVATRPAVAARPSIASGMERMTSETATAPGLSAPYINKSDNWSGAGGTVAPKGSGGITKFDGAYGTWTVPRITDETKTAEYSATWVGVDGLTADDPTVIQTGTAEDTKSATGPLGKSLPYFAWVETYPKSLEVVATKAGKPAVVVPGNKMEAYVVKLKADSWKIEIVDVTRKWKFTHTFTYKGPGDSVEWIQEAPEVGHKVSTLAHFSPVTFSQTAIQKSPGTKANLYSPGLGAKNLIEMVQKGKVVAVPGTPTPKDGSAAGQKFTVTRK